ncbi:hypothetical protein ASD11_09205 [Aeromicrobium sp. Root495]|uniref:type IV toxin-antitoxin system AbiEi family antitoxin domain-containing protein n=1 Tax=Aeromicrobium sp. Root495 TaxID=1736550 RepID=UPI0006F2F8DA|nr:type IV toxin-antitoxin system AbiEi family antitoxin domain-containing protein [Aeromicrobium sp. Root495]KQY59709.1 hypothetical protein ASD11_09205 [Aeromicrobium sp. Root495]
MDDILIAVAHANGGYLMRHQLLDLGYSDDAIRAFMRTGLLRRVRHGTYVPTVLWQSWSDSERHAVKVRSVVDKLGPGVVVTHQSAAALHGFDLWGVDLESVHVTRLDGRNGRTEAGIVFHSGQITEDDCVEVDGRLLSAPQRAALETSASTGVEQGVVVLSSALHLGVVEKGGLEESIDRDFARWQGTRTARVAVRLADGRLESVGESRSFYMMWVHQVPAPELQVEVHDRDGRIIGRSDFGWSAYRHLGEFDGMLKYGRLNPHGEDPGRQIEREKVREDRMRGTRRGMSRWVWIELGTGRSPATAGRLVADMQQSRRLYTRNATHIV